MPELVEAAIGAQNRGTFIKEVCVYVYVFCVRDSHGMYISQAN